MAEELITQPYASSKFEYDRQTSNLDVSTIETSYVLENFDFDAFLKAPDNDLEPAFNENKLVAEISYTISEDLADGKLAQKDRDLRLLLKTAASSHAAAEQPEQGSSSHQDITWDSSPTQYLQTTRQVLTAEADCVHSSFRGAMEAPPLSQSRSNKKRKVERTEANPATNSDQGGHRYISQKFEKQYSEQVQIVYILHCYGDLHKYHAALVYEDPPFREHVSNRPCHSGQVESEHLNGRKPITNLSSYMRTENDDIAIVVFRHVWCADNVHIGVQSDQGLNYTESLAIKSSALRAAIAAVAKCYYNKLQDLDTDPTNAQQNEIEQFSINPAQPFLYHHISRLENYMNSHPEAAPHIKVLLAYCDQKYGQDFAAATQLFHTGLVSQKHLDKLFVPNNPVLVTGAVSGDIDAAYIIHTWPRFSTDGSIEIDCWCWQHDGKRFRRRSISWRITPITSPTAHVQSLSIYPLQFASDETKMKLEARGRKHWSYRRSSHVSYRGWNVSHDEYYPGSRFMIDYKVYRKMHEYGPAFTFPKAPSPRSNDILPSELELHQKPSPTDYLLMPAEIYGFYLTEKQWINILVDGVQSVQWNKSAYERLVLPSATKELVRALVTVRTSQRGVKHGLGNTGKRVDIISGKGNGLIMLLHGGPGTGKSLTAESVAEIAEMPLYRVTCGDIGATPAEVEKYLAAVMYLGTTWNCVLLLDEADVFLEERSMSDLARNSLVSVFLRILEYYDGILILTSNRVGIFDEAFKSRIQVALHYQNLTRAARRKIWTNFIDMLEEDEEDVNFDEIHIHLDELAAFNLNGRQIRNTLTTARELAMFKAECLDWKHLEQALKVSTDFSEYLQTMQGHTDDQKARDDRIR